ncbi:DNA/RNA non-specific endonuclease [Sulfuricurvum sp.]|uniref:DNA/RNA non-specific endonuclease n=1 Tax=Sulfuricurvum sp. TaxID=2025608 RepID=UPI002617BB18|nr:DNA/RNA non-specific endonuclease [Sulfuricurvum sp.]MDD4950826.1 DNA/RNA non-specific endonuclease [Sulfuricurvum sp.]
MTSKILFSTLAIASILSAASTSCGGIYYGNNAPDILNPKLTPKTKELCYSEFAVMHSGLSRTPLWSAEHLYGSKLNIKVERSNDFHPEERLNSDERAELSDYARSGYDRGHMSPARDFNTPQSESECFTLANMVPQDHDNNTKLWSGIEEATRTLAKQKGELYVITGPIFIGTNLQRIGGRVLVPTKIFKAIYDPSSNQGAAYLVNNAPGNEYQEINIAQLEQLTNIRIFPKMAAISKQTPMPLPSPQMHGKDLANMNSSLPVPAPKTVKPSASLKEQCGTKHTCKEMTSCEEATFYFTQCHEAHLDGDGDGKPCNKLCK